MQSTKPLPTAVYVTISRNGQPRYSKFWNMRLWPIRREVAEAAFAAGATVYRKQSGEWVGAEGACEVIGA